PVGQARRYRSREMTDDTIDDQNLVLPRRNFKHDFLKIGLLVLGFLFLVAVLIMANWVGGLKREEEKTTTQVAGADIKFTPINRPPTPAPPPAPAPPKPNFDYGFVPTAAKTEAPKQYAALTLPMFSYGSDTAAEPARPEPIPATHVPSS